MGGWERLLGRNSIVDYYNNLTGIITLLFRYGLEITPTISMAPPRVSEESKDIIRRHLLSYSDWALFGKYK